MNDRIPKRQARIMQKHWRLARLKESGARTWQARLHDKSGKTRIYLPGTQGMRNEEVGREPGNYSAGHVSHSDARMRLHAIHRTN